jgi:AraC-like DNA-binding protein
MAILRHKDGFAGEKLVNLPELVLERNTGNMPFNSSLYITHIGLKETQMPDRLGQSIVFMKNNMHKPLSVEEIAKQFHYSPSHYTAMFKKKTGLSPINYFIRMKIHYACQLLTQRELIIKEIADKIGYEDPYYFSRIFKKVIGKSPTQYKSIV